MRALAVFGCMLVLAGCSSSGRFSSSEFNEISQHAYKLLEDITYRRSADVSDLRQTLAKLEARAKTDNDRDMLLALKGATAYLAGPGKGGISCMVAAREMLKNSDSAAHELTACKTELGQ